MITLVFHCTASVFMNQISRHETVGDGKVLGVVYQNEIGYTGPKILQNNVSKDASIKIIDTCPIKTVFKETETVLRKKDTRSPPVSEENV